MSIIGRIFGVINGIILIGFIFLITRIGAKFTVVGSSIGLLVAIIPILLGLIFSIKALVNKEKKLSLLDKFLVTFPIINTLILLFGSALIVLN